MSILNERIRSRRLELGLTLLHVANALGVREATAQRYESGEIKNIKHDTIYQLSKILQCSPAYLMGWEKAPNQKSSDFALSSHEKDLVVAYREKPNMQSAVDTLLGISSQDTDNIYQIKKAVRNDSEETTIADSEDELVKIPWVARSETGEGGTLEKTQKEIDDFMSKLKPDTSGQY